MPSIEGDPIASPRSVTVTVNRCSCPGEPALDYWLVTPGSAARGSTLLVAVHGISERAESHASYLAPLAEHYGVVVVAPHFARPRFGDYQRLGRSGRGARADHALERVVQEAGRLTGVSTARFSLFGFSGGAQFGHRYLMAHPSRVVAAVLSSAGWYTWPRHGRKYPYGIAVSRRLPDLHFDSDAFLRVPVLVTVGERDVEHDEGLRRSVTLDRQQGSNRVERARSWVDAMVRAAERAGLPPSAQLAVLPGVDHSVVSCMERGQLAERVFEFLFGEPPALPVRRASAP
jgi:pimeloyl-ACP methyl ester carboxylesterase